MISVRRGTITSFSSSDWTALVRLDGVDQEAQMPVGQWVPGAMLAADTVVAVLVFGDTNTDDGVVLGAYGSVSLWNYPALSMLTAGQPLRATSASAAAFGALDLANANAVTGVLPAANYASSGTWTPTFKGSGTAGTFTYAVQVGTYLKLGKLVYVYCRVALSAIAVAPTGNMTIEGLPFTSEAGNLHALAFGGISNFNYTNTILDLIARVNSASTTIVLAETNDNAALTAVPAANFTNAACDLILSGWYMTA